MTFFRTILLLSSVAAVAFAACTLDPAVAKKKRVPFREFPSEIIPTKDADPVVEESSAVSADEELDELEELGLDVPYILRDGNKRITHQQRVFGCPPNIVCNVNYPYRTVEGFCNNLQHPTWGASELKFIRYLPNAYEDGITTPRGEGRSGSSALPNARKVSFFMQSVQPNPVTSSIYSLWLMQFGQWIDHDLFFTPEFEDNNCCPSGVVLQSATAACRHIDVQLDPFYSQHGVKCLQFIRSAFADTSCTGGIREQVNALTQYIDGSQVYGSTAQDATFLRSFQNGKLKVNPSSEPGSCPAICPLSFLPTRQNADGVLEYFAGDTRVEEQPSLTALHTMSVRYHNDLATFLKSKYPSKNDEEIYQLVRRIVGATIQRITYGEHLPILLGNTVMNQRGLTLLPVGTNSYFTGYNITSETTAATGFATAFYRLGHTLIKDDFFLPTKTVQLSRSFNNHNVTITPGQYPSEFLKGIADDPAAHFDHFLVDAINNKLFALSPFLFGSDLYARNIQRGRDHGIPPYNAWRALCSLPVFTNFKQLWESNTMPKAIANQFEALYPSVNEIDLFPALISENPASGAVLGPLLQCVVGKYFYDLKFGDRFWFEGNAYPQPFTFNQINSIRETRLSTLICAYTNALEIQWEVMKLPGSGNPIVNCSTILKKGVPNDISLYW